MLIHRSKLLNAGGGLFERRGLLFRAYGQIVIAGRDFARRRQD